LTIWGAPTLLKALTTWVCGSADWIRSPGDSLGPVKKGRIPPTGTVSAIGLVVSITVLPAKL
jgi:hypothetical protein